MTFDAFIQTKGFGFICMIVVFVGCLKLLYDLGFQRGYGKGVQDNPKKVEASHYVFSDGRILRFVNGKSYLIDLQKNTVELVIPEKQEK